MLIHILCIQNMYIHRIAIRLQRANEKVEAAKAQPAQRFQQAQNAQYLQCTPLHD